MATPDVRFHPEALSELDRSVLWYAERSQLVATTFLDEVSAAIRDIQRFPDASQTYSQSCRKHVLKRFPFSIVYRQRIGVIEIIAIPHHRQKPGYWENR